MSDEIDAQVMALTELAQNLVPAPADVLQDVGPLAVLWYARETVMHAVTTWTAQLIDGAAADVGDDSEPIRSHAAILMAQGMLDEACVTVALLPPEFSSGAPDASAG